MSILKRDPPYAGTTVPPETTWAQVEKLLLDYGAEAVRRTRVKGGAPFKWLDPRGREQKSGRPALLFILDPEKRPCPHCHGSGRV